jgi:prepilin-type N-terminal cleavage/methylation domain-containing protein
MKNKGFTLIELMVVMVIVMILATMSFAGYSRFNQQQQINIVYENLKNDLAEAKSMAMSQAITKCQKETGVTRIFLGYQIQFMPPGNNPKKKSYRLEEVCDQGVGDHFNTGTKIKTIELPTTVWLSIDSSDPTDPSYIRFKSLTGGVDAGAVITLENDRGQKRTITVTSSGNIE